MYTANFLPQCDASENFHACDDQVRRHDTLVSDYCRDLDYKTVMKQFGAHVHDTWFRKLRCITNGCYSADTNMESILFHDGIGGKCRRTRKI